eukprot:6208696-Pleurochrysis_carterae.AAC.4
MNSKKAIECLSSARFRLPVRHSLSSPLSAQWKRKPSFKPFPLSNCFFCLFPHISNVHSQTAIDGALAQLDEAQRQRVFVWDALAICAQRA